MNPRPPETPTLTFPSTEIDFDDAIAVGIGTWIGEDGQRHQRQSAVLVGYPELVSLALVDPWPRFRVTWSFGADSSTELVAPIDASDEEAFGKQVEAMASRVAAQKPGAVDSGWKNVPDVPWERVDALPGATDASGERCEYVAGSRERTPMEALFGWLARRPALHWREQPRKIVATETHVYCERADGVFRLPLAALRVGFVGDNGDGLFIFGKRTRVLLPSRIRCSVFDTFLDTLEERPDPHADVAHAADRTRAGGTSG